MTIKLIITSSILIVVLLVIIIYLIRLNRVVKLEKRIGRYAIESTNEYEYSIFDNISNYYKNLIIKLRKYFNIFNGLSKPYKKYINNTDIKSIDFIIKKFLNSIMFLLLTVLISTLQLKEITILEVIISLTIGYFVLDIYLIYMNKSRTKQIENEMLKAIMIMNNAFKAGKSITQAVTIASNELPEPISSEFKLIYKDMEYGLSVDEVFERFAKRVNVSDARYLSSSLSILNKTGGNIVQVFSNIERNLFDKKKLKEELHNLTAASTLMIRILMFTPLIFSIIIYILSPNYFDPLFNTLIGIFTLEFIILLYILYIFLLNKIMKVKV